jgi:hypothetical protein
LNAAGGDGRLCARGQQAKGGKANTQDKSKPEPRILHFFSPTVIRPALATGQGINNGAGSTAEANENKETLRINFVRAFKATA